MISRILLFIFLTIAFVLIYLRFLSGYLASVAPVDGIAEWAVTILIGVAVGFATGMWRRANPWYVYLIAVLMCVGARSISYFVVGVICTYITHSC